MTRWASRSNGISSPALFKGAHYPILPRASSPRRLPSPWRAEKFSGGYVVRDATGFAVTYVYGRSTEAEALEAKQMTMDEARRVASNIAKLPDMLKRGE